jgi:hypothetical protein
LEVIARPKRGDNDSCSVEFLLNLALKCLVLLQGSGPSFAQMPVATQRRWKLNSQNATAAPRLAANVAINTR